METFYDIIENEIEREIESVGRHLPVRNRPFHLDLGAFLWKNLVAVTIGNIVGGVVFVGLGYWGAYLRPVTQTVKS